MHVPRAARPLLLADSLELGRTHARWFMMGGTDSLLTVMRPDLIASLGGRVGLVDGQAMVATRAGAPARARSRA